MSNSAARATITAYYAAFNAENPAGMLACVSENVEHRVNEGGIRSGAAKFAEFCAHMGVSYRETLQDIEIFVNDSGTRAAASASSCATVRPPDMLVRRASVRCVEIGRAHV